MFSSIVRKGLSVRTKLAGRTECWSACGRDCGSSLAAALCSRKFNSEWNYQQIRYVAGPRNRFLAANTTA